MGHIFHFYTTGLSQCASEAIATQILEITPITCRSCSVSNFKIAGTCTVSSAVVVMGVEEKEISKCFVTRNLIPLGFEHKRSSINNTNQ